MNIITRGNNSRLIFTLNETQTLTSPFYLVVLENIATRKKKKFILSPDLSNSKTRFNEFIITETSGTEILTSGVINVGPAGEWKYRIMEQVSATNLDETLSGKELEVGIIKVIESAESNTYKSSDTQDKEYKF